MAQFPKIQALKWTQVRDVLPNEATGFTPWLAANLDLLADALGLDDLELVGTETHVDAFRLDIRATGTDGSGEEIAVVIENQYGKTDHDHLGKLVTYTARADAEAERVLAVWVVEQPVDAHLAAVEFLNRISAEHVGWVLVSPRFVQSPDGYFIHFEKHAEPNAFLRATKTGAGTAASPERSAFMASVFGRIDGPLREHGFRHVWCHPNGNMIRAYLPKRFAASEWAEVRVLAARNRFRVVLFIRGGQVEAQHNIDVLEGIRQRHGKTIQAALGDEWPIEWHARHENDRSDYARITWEGHGYTNADPERAAAIVLPLAQACLTALSEDGEEEFPDPDELETSVGSADTDTVMAIAAHVRAGEWTTYGDVSTVATGTHTAAMAVGNIAANNPDFPHPHRLLTHKGAIPETWATKEGGGPELCRQRLTQEGVHFLPNGLADAAQRVDVEVLKGRWDAGRSNNGASGQPAAAPPA